MYLSTSKTNRLTATAKTRLHSHKLDNIEPRKRSPEGNSQGPPSPSEVIVFNNTNHAGSGGRNYQPVRCAPEVPQVEEIHRYFRESWDRRMHEINTQKLSVLWIQSDREDGNSSKDGSSSHHHHHSSSGSSQSHSSHHHVQQQQQQNKGKYNNKPGFDSRA